jgi:hypothetical protein
MPVLANTGSVVDPIYLLIPVAVFLWVVTLIYSFDRLTTSTRKALWRASIIVHFAIGLFFFFDAVGFF